MKQVVNKVYEKLLNAFWEKLDKYVDLFPTIPFDI